MKNKIIFVSLALSAIIIAGCAIYFQPDPADYLVVVAVVFAALVIVPVFAVRRPKTGRGRMKKKIFFILFGGIVWMILYYYIQGMLTAVQAIFCVILFSALALLIIHVGDMLLKSLLDALREEKAVPRYLEKTPSRQRRAKKPKNPFASRVSDQGWLLRPCRVKPSERG
ncbi:MAG: hypothetical protein Q8O93_02865 [bacterium]|nr:hypothetical protein [bacterium]